MLSDDEVSKIKGALAAALKARRVELGLSKNLLAQRSGVSVQSVSFIETATNSPSVSTLVRLCHTLQMAPEEIIRRALGAS